MRPKLRWTFLFLIFALLIVALGGGSDVSIVSDSEAAAAPPITVPLSLEPTGMAKPIADLRDYNGTYEGSIGTGTKGYKSSGGDGTLYRDNQDNGALSGCVGEGCGRHPGVDIPLTSGTAVYASLSGVVKYSNCNGGNGSGWGNLIVIQSDNPFKPGEKINFAYAHLKSRTYANGQPVLKDQWVTTGTQIGKSGGKPGVDPCYGYSTGGHLHFQIDRDNGDTNYIPFYPASGTLNRRDDLYGTQLTNATYNPVVFVTGGYRWTFNGSQQRELWDLISIQRWGVSNGALWIDGVGDTYIRRGGATNCGRSKPCSGNFAAEARLYKRVYLDLYNVCLNNPGKIYFTTLEFPTWHETRMVQYYPTSQGQYREHIYMTQNQYWRGVITGLRVDPAQICSNGDDPNYFGEITIEK